jgi:competence protein ComFC
MKDYFSNYKFMGDYRLRFVFANVLADYFKKHFKNYVVIPTPLSPEHFYVRGFNQVEGLLDAAGIKYFSVLKKKDADAPQNQKTRSERLKTVQTFDVSENIPDNLANKKIVLVDDVYTTGRTMYHMKELIYNKTGIVPETFTLAR